MPREKIYIDNRDEIIKIVADQMGMEYDIIEKVISWSYMGANKAVRDKREVEISGLGKFMTSQRKVKKRIETLEKRLSNIDPLEQSKIDTTFKELEYVKTKLNEQTDRIPILDSEGDQEPREDS